MARKKREVQPLDTAASEGGPAGPAVEGEIILPAEAPNGRIDKPEKGAKRKANGSGKKKARTDAASIRLREKQKEALDYRRMGYSYRQIAEQMDEATSTVSRWVREAVREIGEEEASDVRALMLERLDWMLSETMSLMQESFEPALIDTVLKLDDRRARILGLYRDGGDSPAETVLKAMGARMAEMMKMDAPVLRIEAGTPLPSSPVL